MRIARLIGLAALIAVGGWSLPDVTSQPDMLSAVSATASAPEPPPTPTSPPPPPLTCADAPRTSSTPPPHGVVGTAKPLIPGVPNQLLVCWYTMQAVNVDGIITAWTQLAPVRQTGAELAATVAAINAADTVPDGGGVTCIYPLYPTFEVTIGYPDGSTSALAVDVNCGLVTNDRGVSGVAATLVTALTDFRLP